MKPSKINTSTASQSITVQDTVDVSDFRVLDREWVLAQAHAVIADVPIAAVKLGMLGSVEMVDTVLEIIDEAGRVLAEDDDGGDGLASRLVVPSDRKGNLFLRASVIGSGAGAFDVLLTPSRGR